MLLHKPKPLPRICVSCITTMLIMGIYLASHLFILEAHYVPPEVEAINEMTSENTYFIMMGPSSYELYFNNLYVDTITDVRLYPHGIKIYDKEGVLIDEN